MWQTNDYDNDYNNDDDYDDDRSYTFFSVTMTRPSNWSSSPFIVTVKSMITVFALISGVYAGLLIFVVMNNLHHKYFNHISIIFQPCFNLVSTIFEP